MRDTRPVTVTDRQAIHAELERVRADLHRLVADATTGDLRRRTEGTRWTNQQMLFHMVFGYMLVRRLLPLVRVFGLGRAGADTTRPRGCSRGGHWQ